MFTRQILMTYRKYSARMISCNKLSRTLHDTSQLHLQDDVNEINIPVPWGKIAGKLWGSRDRQPILAMHGWQDNAASFDNLAPLLSKNVSILAIDLPGHGLSSWLPPGFMYNEIIYFLLIKRIQRYFGWKKIKLLVHSLSGMTTYWYAATFPEDLQYVIALDNYKFLSCDATRYSILFANAVNKLFKMEEDNRVEPSYTYDELIKKVSLAYESFLSAMDETACKILMTRGSTRKEDGKYIINRDPRLGIMAVHTMFALEHLEEYAKLIKCPYLIVKGSDFYPESKDEFYKILKIMKSVNDNVHVFDNAHTPSLSGSPYVTHHFHMTHAKEITPIITEFLEKYD